MNRRLLLVSGPGGKSFSKKEVLIFIRRLSKIEGIELKVVGDGKLFISIYNIIKALEKVEEEQEVTIIIQSHGTLRDGFHFGSNDRSSISSKKLFQEIRNTLGNKPIDVFNIACHGAGMLLDKEELAQGSTLVSLTSIEELNYCTYYNRMVANFKKFSGDITAYNLLQFYLLNFLKSRYKPFIAVSGQPIIHDLNSILNTEEVRNIPFDNEHFISLGQPPKYLEVYKKLQNIKNEYDISTSEYGIAIGICLNHLKK